ncbi:AlpA family phage regulatory protein [Vibrio sinensis]|uniref:AlpA family phage regulatory protein n=1 Tax=Vibrio sinensis TaxID=2302434 RepID=A0A3A6R2Z3_9VIBR|nr:AlpA family phage regulatory protein [Vibrio sinensis]RJX75714.1 AlpA family phage regulatory protein [Vibrio sinensis]
MKDGNKEIAMEVGLKIETREQVIQRVQLSRATVYRYEGEGKFPPRLKFGDKTGGYLSHEIDYFILACARGEDLKRVVKELRYAREKMIENTLLFQWMRYS